MKELLSFTGIILFVGGFIWVAYHLYKLWESEHNYRASLKKHPQVSDPIFLIEEERKFPYSALMSPLVGQQVYWRDPKGEKSGYYRISFIQHDKQGKVNYAEPFGLYSRDKKSSDEILVWAHELIFIH